MISPKMCILCVRVRINKRSFELFAVFGSCSRAENSAVVKQFINNNNNNNKLWMARLL